METKTVADDQKKRALEALERRFAFAKAESQRQQGRQKRRRDNSNLKPAPAPTSSAGPSVEASPAFGRNTSSTKGVL